MNNILKIMKKKRYLSVMLSDNFFSLFLNFISAGVNVSHLMGPWEIFEEDFREINSLIVRTEVVFGLSSKLQFGSLLNRRNLN